MIDNAVIISTGDELTTGEIVDTNSAAIAQRLSELGIDIAAVLKVGDDRARLHWALCQARELSNLTIGTGGLGSKANDLAVEVVAEFFGCKLQRNERIAQSLLQPKTGGLSEAHNKLRETLVPKGSVIIPNPVGTSVGFLISTKSKSSLIWLPGAHRDIMMMMRETVIPWILQQLSDTQPVLACTFRLHGLTESRLEDLLKSLSPAEGAKLSFRTDFPDLFLRLTFKGKAKRAAVFAGLKSQIENKLAPYIYGEGDKTLEEVVGELFLEKNQTLAVAESCTGGYISHRITRVPGSSAYFFGGAVTYSNEAKILYLGVRLQTLREHGAVSRETALEMSAGIRERLGTSIGVGVTGIAGPTGGTEGKPVGTVWISIARNDLHEARLFRFDGDRERVILGTSQAALDWLRLSLSEC